MLEPKPNANYTSFSGKNIQNAGKLPMKNSKPEGLPPAFDSVDKEFVKAVLVREMAQRVSDDVRTLCKSLTNEKDPVKQRTIVINLADTFASQSEDDLNHLTNELIFSRFEDSGNMEWTVEQHQGVSTIRFTAPKHIELFGIKISIPKACVTISITASRISIRYKNMFQHQFVATPRKPVS